MCCAFIYKSIWIQLNGWVRMWHKMLISKNVFEPAKQTIIFFNHIPLMWGCTFKVLEEQINLDYLIVFVENQHSRVEAVRFYWGVYNPKKRSHYDVSEVFIRNLLCTTLLLVLRLANVSWWYYLIVLAFHFRSEVRVDAIRVLSMLNGARSALDGAPNLATRGLRSKVFFF